MNAFLIFLLFIALLIQVIIAIYLILPFFFLMIHFLRRAGKSKYLDQNPPLTDKNFHFAGIVTAHQDLRFIPPLVDSCIRQTYKNFTIYVVADDCIPGILHFEDPRIVLLYPEKPFHSKINSIKFAVDSFKLKHDVLVIFDSDNLLHPKYFYYINEYYQRGFEAVQTHMLSKNTKSVYAKLDSIGHIYNTFIERQFKMEMGLSSSILGLGISLKTELYKEVMYKDSLGGFDKKLQCDIVKRIPQLAFADEAIVYDEKVEDGHTLERQRTRWIYAYFKYLPIYLDLAKTGIKELNFNKFFFAFTSLRPPLFLLIISVLIFILVGLFFDLFVSFFWISMLFQFALVFILIVLTKSRQKGMWKALIFLPLVVMHQLLAIVKIKKASRSFLKTEHMQVIYIDEILNNETV